LSRTEHAVEDLSQAFERLFRAETGKRATRDRIRKAAEDRVESFLDAAREARTRHRLGLIGRARVAYLLQKRLLAAGYPAGIVKQVIFAMIAASFTGR
jgi:hypothetical protein